MKKFTKLFSVLAISLFLATGSVFAFEMEPIDEETPSSSYDREVEDFLSCVVEAQTEEEVDACLEQ